MTPKLHIRDIRGSDGRTMAPKLHIRDIRGSDGRDKIKNPKPGGPLTACVACGRVLRASKNGHPRKHAPIARGRRRDRGQGTCDGTFLPGEPP